MQGRDAPYAPMRISMKLLEREEDTGSPLPVMRTSLAEELPGILQRMIGSTKGKPKPRPIRGCHKNVKSL